MIKFYLSIFSIALLALVIMWIPNPITGTGYLDLNDENDLKNISVEFHGLVFDLLIFGVVLSFYDFYNQKRNNIKRYLETIDDLRFGNTQEIKLKIVGSIKRLTILGVNELDLTSIQLERVQLTDLVLDTSDLTMCSFSGSNLRGTKFIQCDCLGVDFSNSILNGVSFQNSKLIEVDFRRADINGLIIKECELKRVRISQDQVSYFEKTTVYNNDVFLVDKD